ncbi:MAG: ATPase [Fusobacteriales bacterium]|nr:MAG: ATPase [Fusobacteriales bacterium]
MYRSIYNELLDWKSSSNGKTALLIEGARRIGKSYIAKYFAEKEYKSYIIIDFAKLDDNLTKLFDAALIDLDSFFTSLSLIYKTKLHNRNSLIIFDEVQQFPKARQMIKYLVEDGRYDYIETGSLLSIKTNVMDIVLPSEEESIKMYPITFPEFLLAMGEELKLEYMQDKFNKLEQLGEAVHRSIMKLFREYLCVGGMPQAVVSYIDSKDFEKVDKIKRQILKLYRNDIAKFALRYNKKVLSIFDEIPAQLSKHEKVFNLASISKTARYRSYEDAFMWLDDAMIASPCYNVSDPNVGLRLSYNNAKMKMFMADTGLLISHTFNDKTFMNNSLYKDILFKKLGINEGMIMENIVAQMLKANKHNLFYYSKNRDEKSPAIDIDFLINIDNKISPIEVKSSNYIAHKSLDRFYEKFKNRLGKSYIIYTKDIKIVDKIVCLPVYLTCFL